MNGGYFCWFGIDFMHKIDYITFIVRHAGRGDFARVCSGIAGDGMNDSLQQLIEELEATRCKKN